MKYLFLTFTAVFLQLGFCAAPSVESRMIYSDDFKEGWMLSGQSDGNVVSLVKGQRFRNSVLTYDFRTPGQDAVLISKKVDIPADKKSIIKITFVPDGLRQKLFLILKDKNGESFLMEAGRLLSQNERTVSLSLDSLFVRPDDIKGNIWGGDGNLVFDSPLTEITVGIDNFPDRVNRTGTIKLVGLSVVNDAGNLQEDISSAPQPATPDKFQRAEVHPNIVRNPSFEEGSTNGTPLYWQPARGILTETEGGTHGKHCARWVMNKGVSENIGAYISQMVQVPGGAKTGDIWFFSANVQAVKRVKIGLILECGGTYSEPINCLLFPEDGWQSFLIPFQVINSADFFKPHIYVYQPETPIYIDDVRIWQARPGTQITPREIQRFITPKTVVPEAFEE